jgi:hypothetical protein
MFRGKGDGFGEDGPDLLAILLLREIPLSIGHSELHSLY